MRHMTLSAPMAIVIGGLVAGTVNLAAVLAFWAARAVPPGVILQAIATSLLGPAARQQGLAAEMLGLFLHFAVSFAFATAFVLVALRVPVLRRRPVVAGIGCGVVAYVIMTCIVVPLSRADFGREWPPIADLAVSISIHLFLFGLPIALVASRMAIRPEERAGAASAM